MAKTWAMVFGWIFVVLGVLGFISNPIVGQGAFFHTDAMHNIVHLIFGAVLLWAAYMAPARAAAVMKWEGIIYLLLAIVGFIQIGSGSVDSLLGLAEANSADNWLHIVLAIVLIWAGWRGGKNSSMQTM